jgi:hypothetical protein
MIWGAAAEMPEHRTVLVIAPLLLADLIRHVLIGRVGGTVLVEIAEPADANERLRKLNPDVVIIGPLSAAWHLAAAAATQHPRVLSLSPDLGQILGPDTDDIAPFTPETLANRLREILAAI